MFNRGLMEVLISDYFMSIVISSMIVVGGLLSTLGLYFKMTQN